MKRAYSLFETKSVDDDQRIITGIATTPSPDRDEDIVEPKGAKFSLPMPFLWQHNSAEPVGHVVAAKVTDEDISVSVQLAQTDTPGILKDSLDKAWESLKIGLVRGLSIGFKPIEADPIKGTFGFRFKEWNWLELSAVTIPANSDASIQTVKSLDSELRAASGQRNSSVKLNDSIIRRVCHKPGVVYLDREI